MSILVVVAHPDDEVLLAGGSITHWVAEGTPVRAGILSGQAKARTKRPADEDLEGDLRRASQALGMDSPIVGSFPNIAMNTVPHLDLVQFIESAIQETQANVLVTHHPGDVNDDHRQTARACQAAARLYQRRGATTVLRALLYGEVLSSTDWAYPTDTSHFRPNTFVEIGEAGVDQKLEALRCYRDVMRPYPHPRSTEAIRALATLRGAESGLQLAEAFELAHLNATGMLG